LIKALRFCSRAPAHEQRRTLEAAASLLVIQLFFAVLPFRSALRLLRLRWGSFGSGEANRTMAEDISRAIGRAARHMPFRVACLHQAFAALVMLRRRQLPATVHLGLVRDPNPKGLKAHAWCFCGEVPVVGAETASSFTPIAAFVG
jgi:hypothetical protein